MSSNLEIDIENPIFGYNESLKKRYPIEKLLQMPLLTKRQNIFSEKVSEQDPYNNFIENL